MIVWQLILIQVITFGLIIFFLRLLFYRHTSTALGRLQELNRRNLEKEIALNKEVERVKKERESEIEKGREEARKAKELALEEVKHIRSQTISEAKDEARSVLDAANAECGRLKQEAAAQIEEDGINLAASIIKEIFSEDSRRELQRELVDELIAELGKIEKDKLKVNIKKIGITSSYPLSDTQKKSIKAILENTLSLPLELEEHVDAAIISGLVINLGGLVLDGSLSNKLRKITPLLRKK